MLTVRTEVMPAPTAGQIVEDVTLSAQDVARFNEAREAFQKIRALYWGQIVPALGGFDNPVVGELELQMENVTFATRNFLWPHRQAAASHEAVDVGGGR